MAYACRVELDSVGPAGDRLTTFVVTYPRFVHAELLTHRMLSRNSSSSRAIPIEKMIEQVLTDPAMPVYWGRNQKGMQAGEELIGVEMARAQGQWLYARDLAVREARNLNDLGLHKQIVNRILEPWMWITVIVSATEWDNFFALRCHPDAQPEIRKIAEMMKAALAESTPNPLEAGEWHLPFWWPEDEPVAVPVGAHHKVARMVSTARCARVSYLTHDGRRDLDEDVKLHDRLIVPGHWSPFEHPAMAMSPQMGSESRRSGNFTGFTQYRKTFENENRSAR